MARRFISVGAVVALTLTMGVVTATGASAAKAPPKPKGKTSCTTITGTVAGNIQISNDFQFFICIETDGCHNLDGQYTNFGLVVKGQDVVQGIQIGDKIATIKVQ